MFEYFPILNGRHFNYSIYFMLLFEIINLISLLFVYSIYSILYYRKEKYPFSLYFIEWIQWLIILNLLYIPGIFQTTESNIPLLITIWILNLFILIFRMFNPPFDLEVLFKDNKLKQKRLIIDLSFSIGYLLISGLICYFTFTNLCISSFSEYHGINFNGIGISSRYIREQTGNKCIGICNSFITLPENGSNYFYLNMHIESSSFDPRNIGVKLNNCTNLNFWNQTYATLEDECYLPSQQTISLKSVDITFLQDKHEYLLERYIVTLLFYHDSMIDQSIFIDIFYRNIQQDKFRVVFDLNTLIVGGDNGVNVNFEDLSKISRIDYNASMFIIGGDLAYDNGNKYCYCLWDFYLQILTGPINNSSEEYYLKPILILAIGNHDIGYDGYEFPYPKQSKFVKNLYYFKYFPQRFDYKTVCYSYHYHKFNSETIIIVLDTNFIASIEEQSMWLLKLQTSNIINATDSNIIFSYHYPAYPLCTVNDINTGMKNIILKMKWYWLFQVMKSVKEKIIMVSENHEHLAKFSLIYGEIPFVGNGAFGVELFESCIIDQNYNNEEMLDFYLIEYHVWLLKKIDNFSFNISMIKYDKSIAYSELRSIL